MLTKPLAFSFIVTMVAMAIDMMFHMATGVAVHLPYVLVKLAVVWFTLFFASYWIGINKKDGIIWSFLASALFDFYYNFAEPTLDRTVFTLDEAALFIVVHFFCIIIPYLVILKYIMNGERISGRELSPKRLYQIIIGGAILGSLFTFIPKPVLKANNLLLGLSYNDHILIGTLLLIVALVGVYKLIFKK